MKLVLASQSPRRKEILENLGISFRIVTADTDESSDITDPTRLVEELSLRKAKAVWKKLADAKETAPDTVVLSSDTVVSADGVILGKPRDAADAERMLTLLSGRSHEVISGICLLSEDKQVLGHEITQVHFDALSQKEIADYILRTRPYDKAGAYAIQGEASAFISGIEGDYFNVVGLPVHRLCHMYRDAFGENLI